MKPLKLEVLFGSQDKLSPALKLMIGSSNAASKALKTTRDEIKKLNDQQKQIDGFTKQKKATEDSAKALKVVQDRIKSLRQEMATNPSEKLSKDFDKATKEAKKLKDAHTQNQTKLQELRNELKQTGISTGNLADHQIELSRKITTANTSLDSQKKKLENLNRVQQSHSKMSGNVRTAAMAGAGMAATGSAALFAMRKPIEENKKMDLEQNRIGALGLGKKTTDDVIGYAKAMKTFGTTTVDNLALAKDALTIFGGDLHHTKMVTPLLAKMKFGNEALYGDEKGGENEKQFMDMLKVIELRNGLKSESAFKEQANMIQQIITATGGRVQANEWLDLIKTGGVAAKGIDPKAFYYTLEPLVQEMTGNRVGTALMSANQNLYQGRTTKRAANNLNKLGLIEDASKVHHDKAGQLSFLDVGAVKGAKLFKSNPFEWMEKVLLPQLASKGITESGQIHDAINSIFSNRTAASLYTNMYDQRENIHKNMKLNEGAESIDQISERAKGTVSGKEIEARAKLHDSYLEFGKTIMPAYTKALEMATGAMQSFTGWMQQNPTLAKALGTGLLIIAAGLVAIGGLLLVFSPLILSMLSLRLMMVTLGVQGSALSFALRMLVMPFSLLKGAITGIGSALMWLARLAMAHPILALISAVAFGVYMIYKNWDTIGPYFQKVWSQITGFFKSGIGNISATILNWSPMGLFYSAFAAVMNWFGFDLPTKFSEFGSNIINGLVNGIKSHFPKLKETWNEVANYMPDWLKQRMIIRSPSRVMAGLGGHIVGGIGMGLTQAFPELKNKYNQVLNLFTNKAQSPVMEQIDIAAPVMSKIQTAPKLSPSRQSSVAVAGDTYTIHIHAAPGQIVQDLERQIEQVVMRIQRDKLARVRTIMADQE
ncbi:phage tail tape measure protein [Acinetobacter ursingii]|uniref:phage tail tape measure protein n=1 Tax=Acinetobacter ursingii TaxID=108980 RepID=UPI00300A6047